jgi:hypothetical protein
MSAPEKSSGISKRKNVASMESGWFSTGLDSKDPEHRRLKRIILARHDIRAALHVAKHLIDLRILNVRDPNLDALRCALVICYTRPFIHTKQYPGIPKTYTKFPRKDLEITHLQVIDFRNNFVAHRDQACNSVVLTPLGFDGKFTTSVGFSLFNDFRPIKTLCEFQFSRMGEDIRRALTALSHNMTFVDPYLNDPPL